MAEAGASHCLFLRVLSEYLFNWKDKLEEFDGIKQAFDVALELGLLLITLGQETQPMT